MAISRSPNGDDIASIYADVDAGVGAATLLKQLEPMIERRFDALLDQFAQVAPELGPLLDFRAKIGELQRIRRELKGAKMKGDRALEVLSKIVGAASAE